MPLYSRSRWISRLKIDPCATMADFSLHAGSTVRPYDPDGLERKTRRLPVPVAQLRLRKRPGFEESGAGQEEKDIGTCQQ